MGKRATCLCTFDWSFPTYGTEVGDFTVGLTALKIASSKMVKHEKSALTINTALYHLHLTHLTF
jgi:hypothetical protein